MLKYFLWHSCNTSRYNRLHKVTLVSLLSTNFTYCLNVLLVNLEQISQFVLVFLLFALKKLKAVLLGLNVKYLFDLFQYQLSGAFKHVQLVLLTLIAF